MKSILYSAVVALVICAGLGAQTAPEAAQPAPPAPAAGSFLSNLASPNTLVMAGMVASQFAEAKTDWHYTVAGKSYTLTPAQRLGIAGGTFGAALAIEQAFPKSRKAVHVIGTIVSGYFAGKTIANTYAHGTPK